MKTAVNSSRPATVGPFMLAAQLLWGLNAQNTDRKHVARVAHGDLCANSLLASRSFVKLIFL